MQDRRLDRRARQAYFQQFISSQMESLLKTLTLYALRAGLADADSAPSAALELLDEVTVEALEHLDRFEEAAQPKLWLLSVAANLIKRQQVQRAKLHHREPLLRDLYENTEHEIWSDDELFDRLDAAYNTSDPESTQETIILPESLSVEDRRIIQLAVLNDLNGNDVARELGVTPATARVRLHRALKRLRDTEWLQRLKNPDWHERESPHEQ